MKFNLLVAASALVVGLSISGVSFADPKGGPGPDPKGGPGMSDPSSSNASAAVALSGQDGAVALDFAKGTVGSNSISGVNVTGLANFQQNNGANSIVQDQNTLGAILDCACSTSSNSLDLSLAASQQGALVLGNVSIGASNKAANGSSSSSATHTASATQTGASNHTGSGSFSVAATSTKNGSASTSNAGSNDRTSASARGDDANAYSSNGNSAASDNDNSTFAANGTHSDSGAENHNNSESYSSSYSSNSSWAFAQTAVGSANALGNFTATGLINVSQNNGNNSMLQSGNTVAAIVGKQ